MIVVVTGGRDFADEDLVAIALAHILTDTRVTALYHGACDGADTIAAKLADEWGIPTVAYPVTSEEWKRIGNGAGPRRNRKMCRDAAREAKATGQIAMLLAFPGNRGTRNCIKEAKAAGLTVRDVASYHAKLFPRA